MSFFASNWAIKQQIDPVAKSVLMILAHRANDRGLAWPSVAQLEEDTCFKRKSIIRALQVLRDSGLIKLSGKTGRTKSVNVYEVSSPPESHLSRLSQTNKQAPREPWNHKEQSYKRKGVVKKKKKTIADVEWNREHYREINEGTVESR